MKTSPLASSLPRHGRRGLGVLLALAAIASAGWTQGRILDLGNAYDKILAGGPLMIPIGIASVLLLALTIERAVRLRRARITPRVQIREVEDALRSGDLSRARTACDARSNPFSAAIGAGLRHASDGAPEVEKAVEAAARREITILRRNLRPFSVIASVAPLLGLLGTVQGMIKVFDVVAEEGALGNAGLLSSGISTALVTTFAGLSVAIPALLLHHLFTSKIQRFADEVLRVHHDALGPAIAAGIPREAAA